MESKEEIIIEEERVFALFVMDWKPSRKVAGRIDLQLIWKGDTDTTIEEMAIASGFMREDIILVEGRCFESSRIGKKEEFMQIVGQHHAEPMSGKPPAVDVLVELERLAQSLGANATNAKQGERSAKKISAKDSECLYRGQVEAFETSEYAIRALISKIKDQ